MTQMKPEELRDIITSLKLTQTSMADTIGVGHRTLRHWLGGTSEIPTPVAILLRLMAKKHASITRIKRHHKETFNAK